MSILFKFNTLLILFFLSAQHNSKTSVSGNVRKRTDKSEKMKCMEGNSICSAMNKEHLKRPCVGVAHRDSFKMIEREWVGVYSVRVGYWEWLWKRNIERRTHTHLHLENKYFDERSMQHVIIVISLILNFKQLTSQKWELKNSSEFCIFDKNNFYFKNL